MTKDKLLKWLEIWAEFSNARLSSFNEEEKQAYQQICQLIKSQPEVDKEFIQKAFVYFKEYPSYHRLEEKFIEAGVRVKKEK